MLRPASTTMITSIYHVFKPIVKVVRVVFILLSNLAQLFWIDKLTLNFASVGLSFSFRNNLNLDYKRLHLKYCFGFLRDLFTLLLNRLHAIGSKICLSGLIEDFLDEIVGCRVLSLLFSLLQLFLLAFNFFLFSLDLKFFYFRAPLRNTRCRLHL